MACHDFVRDVNHFVPETATVKIRAAFVNDCLFKSIAVQRCKKNKVAQLSIMPLCSRSNEVGRKIIVPIFFDRPGIGFPSKDGGRIY